MQDISEERYLEVQQQVMLIGALVRELPLDAFLTRARRADAIGPLLHPSHWIAGQDKLALIIRLTEKLRAFQAALPMREEAVKLDVDAASRRTRLGV